MFDVDNPCLVKSPIGRFAQAVWMLNHHLKVITSLFFWVGYFMNPVITSLSFFGLVILWIPKKMLLKSPSLVLKKTLMVWCLNHHGFHPSGPQRSAACVSLPPFRGSARGLVSEREKRAPGWENGKKTWIYDRYLLLICDFTWCLSNYVSLLFCEITSQIYHLHCITLI